MHFSILRKPRNIIPLAVLALAVTVSGDPPNRPGWWLDGDLPIITGTTENNKGPANIGQAKHMVSQALRALDTAAPTIATQVRADLAGPQPGHSDRIIDLTVPDPKDSAWIEKQKAPLLLGQLKAIAHPFYTRLNAANPAWLATERTTNGTNHPNSIFPWTTETTDDANKSIATIGQLKAVFSLRFEALDSDNDGLVDSWELQHFTNLDQTASADPDNDGLTNAQEYAIGTNPATIGADGDGNGLPDDWELANAGKFAAYPPLLSAALFKNESSTAAILLKNDTAAPVNYSISLSNNSKPGYSYKDSLTGGVAFTWENIAEPENLLSTISDQDDAVEPVTLGFNFPFSGSNNTMMWVSSNGLITFGNNGEPLPGFDQTFPNPWAPEKLIAPFWAELAPAAAGEIYQKNYEDHIVIQYENVNHQWTGGRYTFQVILYSNGNIKFLYKAGTDDGAAGYSVVGIQDSSADMGIQIPTSTLFNGVDVAVLITPAWEFFSTTPLVGVVGPKTVATVSGNFESRNLPTTVYEAGVSIANDIPGLPPQLLTARLQVKWDGHHAAVALTSPVTGQNVLQGKPIEFAATASDYDGITKVEFYTGITKIGEAITQSGDVYRLAVPSGLPPGNHQIIARAVTIPGITTDSVPITLIVIADSDLDGMPDQWELDHGLNPNDPGDPRADADGDGLTNLEEYLANSNPNFPRIHSFAETYNQDGTITYTWVSHASLGDWFRIEDLQPDGTLKTLYATTYGSDELPFLEGSTSYSLTLDPATDYLP